MSPHGCASDKNLPSQQTAGCRSSWSKTPVLSSLKGPDQDQHHGKDLASPCGRRSREKVPPMLTDTTDKSRLVYLLVADLSSIWADLRSWKLPWRPNLCFLVEQHVVGPRGEAENDMAEGGEAAFSWLPSLLPASCDFSSTIAWF